MSARPAGYFADFAAATDSTMEVAAGSGQMVLVANVAHVNLSPYEAKAFLERRHRACLHQQ